MMRESTSRPNWSVPSQFCQLGGRLIRAIDWVIGS